MKDISLLSMTPSDDGLTIDWITRQYGFNKEEVVWWVHNLHFNWPLSVKAIKEDGSVVGLLNMSDYRIEEETEAIIDKSPLLLEKLNKLTYTAVFSFIVSQEYRHTSLNYDMIMSIMPQLRQYDFVFIPVLHRIKTHQYWQRWGAREFFRDDDCVYYMWPFSDAAKDIIK